MCRAAFPHPVVRDAVSLRPESAVISWILLEIMVEVYIPLVYWSGVHIFLCGIFQPVVDYPPFRPAVALQFEPSVSFHIEFFLPLIQNGLQQGSERLSSSIFLDPVVRPDRRKRGFCEVGHSIYPVAPEFVEPYQGIAAIFFVTVCLGKHQHYLGQSDPALRVLGIEPSAVKGYPVSDILLRIIPEQTYQGRAGGAADGY